LITIFATLNKFKSLLSLILNRNSHAKKQKH
jgi:hypothetical protein